MLVLFGVSPPFPYTIRILQSIGAYTNIVSDDLLRELWGISTERTWKFCSAFTEYGHNELQQNSTYPDAGYPDRLGPSGKFDKNSKKLTCLKITGFRIKYSAVLWLRTSNQAWSKGLDAGICCKY
jgi:hypothetical protein